MSEAQLAKSWMLIGAAPERPVIFALGGLDRQVIDAGDAHSHQPCLVELPVLVAIRAKVLPTIVVPLISESNRDTVARKRPYLLDQSVIELTHPLALEEGHDFGSAAQELGAIAPAAVLAVSEGDFLRIAQIPGVFGHSRLERGGACVEGRQRRS